MTWRTPFDLEKLKTIEQLVARRAANGKKYGGIGDQNSAVAPENQVLSL